EVLAAEAVANGFESFELDFGFKDTGFELVDAVAEFLMKLPGHFGHRLGRADVTPLIEGLVAFAAAIADTLGGEKNGIVGGVGEEEIGRELWVFADGAAEQVAKAEASRFADCV